MPVPIGYLREPVVFIAAGAALATPLLVINVRLAPRLGLIDWPKTRGVAERQIPIVGHSLVLMTLATLGFLAQNRVLSPWFLLTSAILATMGHLDDRRPLPPLDKFLFQLACAAVAVYLDPKLYQSFTVEYGIWGSAWAILFLVGIVNAVNFVDGIDGLAGMVMFLAGIGFLLMAGTDAETLPLRCVAALITGMMIPFLYTNVVRGRGFLGNVGSYFFSFVLGLLHLSTPVRAGTVTLPEWLAPLPVLMLAALCFAVPVADALQVVFARVVTGRSPFHPDRGHLHHRLLQTTLPLRFVLVTFGIIEVGGVASAAAVSSFGAGIRAGYLPLVLGGVQILGSAALILLVEHASRQRLRSYFETLEAGEPIYFLKYRLRHSDGKPISRAKLRRIEARVAAEIRVTDTCFAEAPDQIFITLKGLPEPMRNIISRIGVILQEERLTDGDGPEQGEFSRVLAPEPPRKLKSS